MKKFRNENEIRYSLERDYPVPDRLSPENIEASLKGDKKRSDKSFIKRLTAVAAAVTILAAGTLTALHLNGSLFSSDPDGKSVVNTPIENESQSLSVVYYKNSYKDIYRALMKQKKEYQDKSYMNGIEIAEDFETDAEAPALGGTTNGISGNSGAANDIGDSSEASDDYYKTHLQTEGVDEADVIKTDGRFIYYISSDCLFVVDPNHGEPTVSDRLSIESSYRYWGSPQLYLSGGKLTLIYTASDNNTVANVYSVTDKGTLESMTSYSQRGYYTDSRMIKGKLYLITTDYVLFNDISAKDYESYIPTYEINGDTCLVDADDIYLSQSCPGYCYTTVGSFDIEKQSPDISIKSTLGGSASVYCSLDNLYLMRGFYDKKSYTEITRISLKDGKLSLSAAGTVEGYVKDQFSADEYNGFLRVAVTRVNDNAVYVLDKGLKIVGSVDGMGENEVIKSVSFAGDTGYVVTFRQTDPLYTIDLSDPTKPVITDALKVSGFSTHLRAFGDGLLLGFGQEADIETGGTTGIKLSMFRQTEDGKNDEIAKVVIGDEFSYAYSVALWDHKYLMILPDKGLIGFPLYEDSWSYYDDQYGYGEYMNNYSYTIYRYTENGFEEFSKIYLNNWYDSETRAVYIDDVIYVFTFDRLISVDMNSGEVISSISLYD